MRLTLLTLLALSLAFGINCDDGSSWEPSTYSYTDYSSPSPSSTDYSSPSTGRFNQYIDDFEIDHDHIDFDNDDVCDDNERTKPVFSGRVKSDHCFGDLTVRLNTCMYEPGYDVDYPALSLDQGEICSDITLEVPCIDGRVTWDSSRYDCSGYCSFSPFNSDQDPGNDMACTWAVRSLKLLNSSGRVLVEQEFNSVSDFEAPWLMFDFGF